jgi:hypothetical protein
MPEVITDPSIKGEHFVNIASQHKKVFCTIQFANTNFKRVDNAVIQFNPLRPELNPSAQRCLTRSFYWGFCFLNRAFR